MKKFIYVTFLASLLVFLSISVAQDLTRIFSGRIQTIDAANRTIVVKSGEKEMVFRISGNATIKTDYGEKMAFNELKITMSVTVEYTKEGDSIHPLSVKVNTMPKGIGNKQKQEYIGWIETVDDATRTIVVRGGGETESFHIFQDTKIDVPFNELKKGMLVNVEYYKMGNLKHPLRINAKLSSKATGKKQKAGIK
jgi:hypothetical protein